MSGYSSIPVETLVSPIASSIRQRFIRRCVETDPPDGLITSRDGVGWGSFAAVLRFQAVEPARCEWYHQGWDGRESSAS
jgi:hypothetical protein